MSSNVSGNTNSHVLRLEETCIIVASYEVRGFWGASRFGVGFGGGRVALQGCAIILPLDENIELT